MTRWYNLVAEAPTPISPISPISTASARKIFPFSDNSALPPQEFSQLQQHRLLSHLRVWEVILIVVAGFVLLATVSVILTRTFLSRLSTMHRTAKKGILKSGELSLRRFRLEELQKATQNFSSECLIGRGAFGNVYKGTFEVEGTLAIKKAHVDSYKSTEEFRNEVRLLSKVKHNNLVALVGFCEERGVKGTRILVYEYVPNGSLLEYIIGRNGRSFNWRQRVKVAIGAAKGIAHLHDGVQPSIIHRDIKPSNILIGDEFEAKVSDFGLVRMGPIGDNSHVSSQIKGTPGYMDPAYFSTLHLSPLSDVYSFGVILLQLISARPALDTTRRHSDYHIVEWARPSIENGCVEDILDVSLLTEPCNMEIMLKIGQLALRCVMKNPKDRPTMTQVWQELEETLYLYDNSNYIQKQPSMDSHKFSDKVTDQMPLKLSDINNKGSESFVSIDGVGFQRFHVEMDGLSSRTASLRCLEVGTVSFGSDSCHFNEISEEKITESHLNM